MGYTKKNIIDKCKEYISDVSNFYKADIVNYRGKTDDTNEYYTEVIAKYLCENIEKLENIRKVTRQTSYRTQGHDGIYSEESNREEEITAMQLYRQCRQSFQYDYIGKIIDYQTPLKNKKTDESGKIDLLSVNGDAVFILELKKENSTETMLRCVLEGYTYLKTVDISKLLLDFNLVEIKSVCAAPLVFRGMSQWKEMQEERPQLFRLMELINCKPYYIHKEYEKYIVTED